MSRGSWCFRVLDFMRRSHCLEPFEGFLCRFEAVFEAPAGGVYSGARFFWRMKGPNFLALRLSRSHREVLYMTRASSHENRCKLKADQSPLGKMSLVSRDPPDVTVRAPRL